MFVYFSCGWFSIGGLLSFELFGQHYTATINGICVSNKAIERRILRGNVTPRLAFTHSTIIECLCIFPAAVSLSVGSTYAWCGHTDEDYSAWWGKLEESVRYLRRYVMADGTMRINDTYGLGCRMFLLGGVGAAYWLGVDGASFHGASKYQHWWSTKLIEIHPYFHDPWRIYYYYYYNTHHVSPQHHDW